MKLKKGKKKRNQLGLLEESNQMRRRRECENSQISVKQLNWKFGTNSSFQIQL